MKRGMHRIRLGLVRAVAASGALSPKRAKTLTAEEFDEAEYLMAA